MGIAVWPGGSVANWGSGINADTAVPGLNPCNATNNYNNTGLSDADYLVTFNPSQVTLRVHLVPLKLSTPSIATYKVPFVFQADWAAMAFEGQDVVRKVHSLHAGFERCCGGLVRAEDGCADGHAYQQL